MKAIINSLILMLSIVVGHQSYAGKITGNVKENDTNQAMAGVQITIKGKTTTANTDEKGAYTIDAEEGDELMFAYIGYETVVKKVGKSKIINVVMESSNMMIDKVTAVEYGVNTGKRLETMPTKVDGRIAGVAVGGNGLRIRGGNMMVMHRSNHAETYAGYEENKFKSPLKEALSTFAADVDAASYSNIRRFIHQGQIPPKDAVRIEEMINYFQYDLESPKNGDPVNITTELTQAPWNNKHQLLRVSLKAKNIPTEQLPSSNFVFLIDVSGSMYGPNRLPLVKSSLKMLVDQLRDNDKVAIVTYAGSAGVKLESTSGNQKMKIKDAIDQLEAAGSTAGGAGIKKAYQIARENFIKGGNNRIIMASDGDFNVGASSDDDMEQLIARERESGVHISIFGYGMGNLKDSKMERLANKGHGNYAYIDNISEARKAIITEFGGTLFTVAKDVKIQVEFNPHFVQAYRLVGYENRLLAEEDFNNDTKLGGDMGVGHTVTALYEIVPVGVDSEIVGSVDELKYQVGTKKKDAVNTSEIATVKFRYKEPDGSKSKLKQITVRPNVVDLEKASADLRFATAVAELGMLIRNSEYK